ncbi:MAG: helix-hairpin-helix domain-containing protein [Pirellulaceae bacterium]|nr:helix-hairpin-helix domain-containing protein [Pirellulaceae bacterium]
MENSRSKNPTQSRLAWQTKAQRLWLAALISLGYVLIAKWWLYEGGFRGRLVDINQVAPPHYQFSIDLNECDWPELTVLPGISETMARRIIGHRDRRGAFQRIEQLREVRGIGPKTLQRLQPFLECHPGRPKVSSGAPTHTP